MCVIYKTPVKEVTTNLNAMQCAHTEAKMARNISQIRVEEAPHNADRPSDGQDAKATSSGVSLPFRMFRGYDWQGSIETTAGARQRCGASCPLSQRLQQLRT